MQRLHQEDLSAHLQSSNGWEILKIPALASKDIEYNFGKFHKIYKEGEILDDIRNTRDFLQNLEREIGSRNYAAQFLQEPLPANYHLLSRQNIHYFEKLPDKFDFLFIAGTPQSRHQKRLIIQLEQFGESSKTNII